MVSKLPSILDLVLLIGLTLCVCVEDGTLLFSLEEWHWNRNQMEDHGHASLRNEDSKSKLHIGPTTAGGQFNISKGFFQ